MQIQVQDRAPLTRTRKLADGGIAAIARFARTGVQAYTGAEVGRPDLGTVNVYRPESEVFDEAAMASFAHKTITLDHPGQAVDAANWGTVAKGWTEGKVARDGEFVEIPLILADGAAVAAYESGKATELSAGYSCSLVWGDGVAPDGTKFQATQKQIRGNHIALVEKGKAGSECRIGDAMTDTPITAVQRAAVDAYLGDKAKGWTDNQYRGALKALPKEVLDDAQKALTKTPEGNDPKTIDEAVRAELASQAKSRSRTVEQMLAEMEQSEIQAIVSEVAMTFVSRLAAGGVVAGLTDGNPGHVHGVVGGTIATMRSAARMARALSPDAVAGHAGRAAVDVARAAQYDITAGMRAGDFANGRALRDAARAASTDAAPPAKASDITRDDAAADADGKAVRDLAASMRYQN